MIVQAISPRGRSRIGKAPVPAQVLQTGSPECCNHEPALLLQFPNNYIRWVQQQNDPHFVILS